MPDFRVRFVGDLGNLKQFDAAIRNSAGESARQIEAANRTIATRLGQVTQVPKGMKLSDMGAGLFIDPRTQRAIVDSYNNTFKQSGEIVRRSLAGYTEAFDEAKKEWTVAPVFTEEYFGAFNQRIGNVKAYEAAIKRTATTERAILRAQEAHIVKKIALLQQIDTLEASIHGKQGAIGTILSTATDPFTGQVYSEQIALARERQAKLQAGTLLRASPYGTSNPPYYPHGQYVDTANAKADLLKFQKDLRDAKTPQPGFAPASAAGVLELENKVAYVEHILANAERNRALGIQELDRYASDYERILTEKTTHISAEIAKLETAKAKLGAQDAALATKLQKKIDTLRARNPAYEAARVARSQVPPIDTNLNAALTQSPELRQRLLAGGLGAGQRPGSREFLRALQLQEAQVSRFTKNFRTNITSVEGSFREFNAKTGQLGILNNFTVDLDKNGKVVGRWGGQLSGAGAIIKQTVRDFQKVIEWTLATTAVFGTLGLVIKSLSTINELNASLTRFSITAQLSAEETKELFSALGDVAIATATPLKDLVQVSDEIALATKQAGDSTDEWKNKIIDLTTAVGIFTNLTGEDTVAGADKLSSAFKQLGVAPGDLISVLNKVTAVAGGQSTAINEIVTALGGVSEAGRIAGLTMDEQIAAVQVLGQVTNKSAADVATAFKNLFGSLASPGSEKILKEFGISVRDASGNLRPFLTIYREINKAVAEGIIPAGKYQDVIRGISGGPRRAPDAAALLANLPAVDAAIEKAAGASNEALIANAKILDTNQAKIIQLQNAFDIALFERFGEVVKDVTDSFTGLLTQILKTFNAVDPTIVAILVQLGAVVVAGKLLGTVFRTAGLSMIDTFKNLGNQIRFSYIRLDEFTKKAAIADGLAAGKYRLNSAGRAIDDKGVFAHPGRNERFIALNDPRRLASGARQGFRNLGAGRQALLVGGIGAGIGIADKVAGGALEGVDPQTIGSFLQLAGAVSVATGVFAPLGVAALVAGTAISFLGGETEKVKQSAAETAAEVYGITQSLQKAQADAATYTEAQKQSRAVLDSIVASGKTDAETKAAQASATSAFVDATIALANANNLVNDSFDELLLKLDDVGPKYAKYKNIVGNARGGPNNTEVQNLANEIAAEILRASGTSTYIPSNQQDSVINPFFRETPLTAPIITDEQLSRLEALNLQNPQNKLPFDANILKTNPEKITDLIDTATGEFKQTYAASTENLAILAGAINQIPALVAEGTINLNQQQIDTLIKATNDFLAAQSSFFEIQSKLQGRAAQIEALGAIGGLRGKDLENAQLRNTLAQQLQQLLPNADRAQTAFDTERGRDTAVIGVNAEQIIADIKRLTETGTGGINFGALSPDELRDVGEHLLRLNNIFPIIRSQGEAAFKEGLAKMLKEAGVPAEQLSFILQGIPGDIEDIIASEQELAEAAKRLSDAHADALNKYAARNAALREGENSGQFDKNAEGLKKLKEQSDEAYQSEIQLIDSINSLSGDALIRLQNELANVTGLENASLISKEQLGGAIVDLGLKAGLSGAQIRSLGQDVISLITLIESIPRFKKIILFVETQFSTKGAQASGGYISAAAAQALLTQEKNAKDGLAEAKAAAAALRKQLESLFKSGSGSNFGSAAAKAAAAATKKQPDVSQIDLPDEIANAVNRSALIQEAIKRARALQKTIPGATKEGKDDIVALLKGTQNILNVRGIKDDLLRRALEELADIEKKRLEFETKADTIRRIRVGAGDFSALANVPVNSRTGVSLGGANGPINVTLNLNGTILTPAQLAQFADLIAAALKRQIAG